MKRNSLFSQKYLIKFLLVIFIVVTSCEKIDVSDWVDDRENTKDLVMEWGQSANGRWIPYLLDKAKNKANEGEMDQALKLFYSYMQVLNTAKGMFKSELIDEIELDISKSPNVLDSIYRTNYGTINMHLAESGVMDQLWDKYVDIVKNKLQNDRWKSIDKLASTDPPADVSACNTKQLFDLFFVDITLIPNFYTTPIFELMDLADESTHGCRPATLAQIGIVMSVVYSHQNPSPEDCTSYGNQIEDLLIKHLNCPIEGEGGGGEDPYPPIENPGGYYVDCAGVPYGPAYIGTCGICIGGSTGITSCDDVSPYPKPTAQQIANQIANKPFALFGDLDCDIVRQWVETARHQVQQAQIDKLNSVVNNIVHVSILGIPVYKIQDIAHVQSINNAYSTVVNMDYFPIRISQLPVVDGQRLTASQFKEYIRKNINSFVNTAYSKFEPYRWHGINDEFLWNSVNPLNTMIGIDIGGPDNGTVIVSKHNNTGWTFTTVYDPKYGTHPVSGNRDFGYFQNSDGSYTFYTRGVDRLTTGVDASMQNVAFFAADELWKSFQQKVKSFVDGKQGSAAIGTPDIQRPDWVKVKDVIDGKKPLSTLSTDCND